MISNTDSTLLIYSTEHIPVKVYMERDPKHQFWSAGGDAPSDAFLAGAIQERYALRRRGSSSARGPILACFRKSSAASADLQECRTHAENQIMRIALAVSECRRSRYLRRDRQPSPRHRSDRCLARSAAA